MAFGVHINSQGEKLALEDRRLDGKHVRCLVLYDDPPPKGTGTPAPMLLDEGTVDFLLEQLGKIKVLMSSNDPT